MSVNHAFDPAGPTVSLDWWPTGPWVDQQLVLPPKWPDDA